MVAVRDEGWAPTSFVEAVVYLDGIERLLGFQELDEVVDSSQVPRLIRPQGAFMRYVGRLWYRSTHASVRPAPFKRAPINFLQAIDEDPVQR